MTLLKLNLSLYKIYFHKQIYYAKVNNTTSSPPSQSKNGGKAIQFHHSTRKRTKRKYRTSKLKVMPAPKKQSNRRPEIRSLKIQPKRRINKYSEIDVPEIKLCGSWLEKLGFVYGQRVLITTMDRLLVIRLEEE